MVERARVEPLDEVLKIGGRDGGEVKIVVADRCLDTIAGGDRGVAESVVWVVGSSKEGGGCEEYFEMDGEWAGFRAGCYRYRGAKEVSVVLALVNWR